MTNIKDLISDLKSISENETVEDMRQAVLDLVNELEEIVNHEKGERCVEMMNVAFVKKKHESRK